MRNELEGLSKYQQLLSKISALPYPLSDYLIYYKYSKLTGLAEWNSLKKSIKDLKILKFSEDQAIINEFKFQEISE